MFDAFFKTLPLNGALMVLVALASELTGSLVVGMVGFLVACAILTVASEWIHDRQGGASR